MAKEEYQRCQAGEIIGCDKTLAIKDYVAENDASTGLVFIAMAKVRETRKQQSKSPVGQV